MVPLSVPGHMYHVFPKGMVCLSLLSHNPSIIRLLCLIPFQGSVISIFDRLRARVCLQGLVTTDNWGQHVRVDSSVRAVSSTID